jgi:hypothetical protein
VSTCALVTRPHAAPLGPLAFMRMWLMKPPGWGASFSFIEGWEHRRRRHWSLEALSARAYEERDNKLEEPKNSTLHSTGATSIELPWYGPVCLVVWEGGSREAPPYPDCHRQLHSSSAPLGACRLLEPRPR